MATKNTQKNPVMDDDDCFMDDIGNEGINLIGVASDRSDDDFEPPVEQIKLDEDIIRKSKDFFKKSSKKARSRYMDEDDNVQTDMEEEMYSKPNLHLGQLIFNNHNIVQNINMFPQTSMASFEATESMNSGPGKSEKSETNQPYSGRAKKPINASAGYLHK